MTSSSSGAASTLLHRVSFRGPQSFWGVAESKGKAPAAKAAIPLAEDGEGVGCRVLGFGFWG